MDANSEKKIKVLPNGPYEVIGEAEGESQSNCQFQS